MLTLTWDCYACPFLFRSVRACVRSVYHQRQGAGDLPYWMYGSNSPLSAGASPTYLYAILGKVSEDDNVFDMYSLRRACIPQSYIDASDEEATSSQGNDIVIFAIDAPFRGPSSALATIASSIEYDKPRDYLLPQYPSDVAQGERLVIDMNYTPIVFRPFQGGMFFSVNLASWSGSSGGPIVDVAASNAEGRPVVLGVLMSSGWSVCDSGIVPVATAIPIVNELLAAAR